MPLKRYYKGHGHGVMRTMKNRYGKREGARVFYATANKMRQGSKRQRAAQPQRVSGPPRRGRRA